MGGAALTLTAKTHLLGLRLYALIGISVTLLLAVLLLVIFYFRSALRRQTRVKHASGMISFSMKEIVVGDLKRVGVEKAGDGGKACCSSGDASSSSSEVKAAEGKMRNIGWGRWYTLSELEAATSAFDRRNIIGEGGYGVVYRGVLPNLSVVAVKNLLNNKGQAEKEFKVEVEAIGKVRHKNLVGLLGYCAEAAKRMLVYEYVDNGTLEQWLHGDVGTFSPLTWDIRLKIAIGTAKGIAYLHEGLEPKVVHRDIKSSNILLDKQWNPKVSDFGLAKLLGPDSTFVTTRVMGTFGYVAPEYASTGMLNEASDVYSFGVLLMEIISGRNPVDYGRPVGEVNLVEWFKGMIGRRQGEEVLDPLIEVQPSPRALKRVLLICLRCIDSDAHMRPKMGQIVHMLEGDEFPFRTEQRLTRAGEINSSNACSTGTKRSPLTAHKSGDADEERQMCR